MLTHLGTADDERTQVGRSLRDAAHQEQIPVDERVGNLKEEIFAHAMDREETTIRDGLLRNDLTVGFSARA